jgi:hypothetical protein
MNSKTIRFTLPEKNVQDLFKQFTLGSYVNYDAYMEAVEHHEERERRYNPSAHQEHQHG